MNCQNCQNCERKANKMWNTCCGACASGSHTADCNERNNLCKCGRIRNSNYSTCCGACAGGSHTAQCHQRQQPTPADLFTYSDHLALITDIFAIINVLYPKWYQRNATTHMLYFKNLEKNNDVRTNRLVSLIKFLIGQGISVIGLQEVGSEFAKALLEGLKGTGYQILYPWTKDNNLYMQGVDPARDNWRYIPDDYQIIVYDATKIQVDLSRSRVDYFGGSLKKRIMTVCMTKGQQNFYFINSHVEFAQIQTLTNVLHEIATTIPQGTQIMVAGDFNCEISNHNIPDDYMNMSTITKIVREKNGKFMLTNDPGFTHLDTNGKSVKYDHILDLRKL